MARGSSSVAVSKQECLKKAKQHLQKALDSYRHHDFKGGRQEIDDFCNQLGYAHLILDEINKLVLGTKIGLLETKNPIVHFRFLSDLYDELGDFFKSNNRRRAKHFWRQATDKFRSWANLGGPEGAEKVLYLLHRCFIKLSEFEKAKETLEECICLEKTYLSGLDPSRDFYWVSLSNIALYTENLASCFLWLGNTKQAEKHHMKALDMFSNIVRQMRYQVEPRPNDKQKVEQTKRLVWDNLILVEDDAWFFEFVYGIKINRKHILFSIDYARLIIRTLVQEGDVESAAFGGWCDDLIRKYLRVKKLREARKTAHETAAYCVELATKESDQLEAAFDYLGAGEYLEMVKSYALAFSYYQKAFDLIDVNALFRSCRVRLKSHRRRSLSDDIEAISNVETLASFAEKAGGISSFLEKHEMSKAFYHISARFASLFSTRDYCYSKGLAFFESSIVETMRGKLERALDQIEKATHLFDEACHSVRALKAPSRFDLDYQKAATFRKDMCVTTSEMLEACLLRREGLRALNLDLIKEARRRFSLAQSSFLGLSLAKRLTQRERSLLRSYSAIARFQILFTNYLASHYGIEQFDTNSVLEECSAFSNVLVSTTRSSKRSNLQLWLLMLRSIIRCLKESDENEWDFVVRKYSQVYKRSFKSGQDKMIELLCRVVDQYPFATPAPMCPLHRAPSRFFKLSVLRSPRVIELGKPFQILVELERTTEIEKVLRTSPCFIEYSIPELSFRGLTKSSLPYSKRSKVKVSIEIPLSKIDVIPKGIVTLCLRPIAIIGQSCFQQIGEETLFKAKLMKYLKKPYDLAKDYISDYLEIGYDRIKSAKHTNLVIAKLRNSKDPHTKLIEAFETLLQKITQSAQVRLHGTKEYSGVDIAKKLKKSVVIGFQIKSINDDISEDKIRAETSKALEYNMNGFVWVYGCPISRRVESSIQAAYHHFTRVNETEKMYCALIDPELLAELFGKYSVHL